MSNTNIPHLRKTSDSAPLIVKGKPFLALGGELQNSSLSSSKFMKDVWGKLKAANLNTVLGSVAWEQIEPVEGSFQFDELDSLVKDARASDMHLVLLWFGSFKNARSTYAPGWVKQNAKRFPRAKITNEQGKLATSDSVSVFGEEARKADARAFAALMQRVKELDEEHSTVIMVQVENEVGLLGDSRDRSSLADGFYNETVPEDLLQILKGDWSQMNDCFRRNFENLRKEGFTKSPTWSQLSGDKFLIDELFMAHQFALYVNEVAAAGKAVYPLPMYTNVWQNYMGADGENTTSTVVAGGDRPGDYPSGGGVTNVLDVWQLLAPSLDFVAPDVYLNDYPSSCGKYRHRGQPLFIPEQRRDEYGARRVWTAMGSHKCIGTAPFGIDTLESDTNPFKRHYGLLNSVSTHILAAQAQDAKMKGFFFDELRDDGTDPSPPFKLKFGSWELLIERSRVFGKPSAGSGLVIDQGDDQFLLVGWGFQVSFTSTDPKATFSGILSFEEKEVVDIATGEMRTLRWLNGDETQSGKCATMPSEDPDYGGFPICVTIPAHTGVATCVPYALLDE